MRIGELSERTGVSTRSLRYYEQQGLLSSERSSGGHRNYTEREVDRVNYLQGLYTAGLNSQVILEVLPCLETPSDETSDAAFERLVEVRDKLRTDIAGLTRTLQSLDELITFNRARRAGE
ncbi:MULTISPECIES: MerR family transcriptional regulator [Actinoplanes]|uniref:MerR family transcriptional regulator n=1 Tax=Actinoplanes TaxID=1865 RepID=UPI0005F2F6D9|nr:MULTISPECIES: MerR family transcriptional regulator [Actinoplanes]GLY04580.1 MerR family transcriptional regulator [Actinoplanes sp. NBRC 101535]